MRPLKHQTNDGHEKLWVVVTCLVGVVTGFAMNNVTSIQHNKVKLTSDASRALVSLEGQVASRPKVFSSTSGNDFHKRISTQVPLSSVQLINNTLEQPARVEQELFCIAWIDGDLSDLKRGTFVKLSGWASLPSSPKLPGGFNQLRWANHRGIDLLVSVPEAGLVHVLYDREPVSLLERIGRFRDDFHRTAGGAATNGLSPVAGGTIRALLLGQRGGREFSSLMNLLQRLGVSHLLAISGLHLAIAVGGMVAVARLCGAPSRTVGMIVIVVALAALWVVEVRPPLMRAAVMAMFWGLSLILGRSISLTGTLSIAAITILIVRPQELNQPGFQLSFGVVMGLVFLTPLVIQRWTPSQIGMVQSTHFQKVKRWIRDLSAAALVAWFIATPLVAYHFHIFSPLGAPLGVALLLPVITLMIFGAFHITLGLVFGITCAPLCWCIDRLVITIDWAVENIGGLPGTWWPLPEIPAVFCLAGVLWAISWAVVLGLKWRSLIMFIGVLIFGLLIASSLALGRTEPLRIDMLDVGNGSSYLLRSGYKTALFDAGSQSGQTIGPRAITPALHALGVRRLDSLILSHAHLDHISGALEVIREFKPKQLVITPNFIEASKEMIHHGRPSLVHDVIEFARNQGVLTKLVTAGTSWQFGEVTVKCLAPSPNIIYDSHNDASMVLQMEVAGRRVLLTGDIEDQGIDLLLKSTRLSDFDIVEAPHHGEESKASMRFIDQVNPLIVLQSSKSLRDGKWLKLPERIHLHTAYDGTCSVVVSSQGVIHAQRWNGPLEQEPHRHR